MSWCILVYIPVLIIYLTWVYYIESKPPFTDICTGFVQSFYSLNFGEKGTLNRAGLIIGRGRPLNYTIITSRLNSSLGLYIYDFYRHDS